MRAGKSSKPYLLTYAKVYISEQRVCKPEIQLMNLLLKWTSKLLIVTNELNFYKEVSDG